MSAGSGLDQGEGPPRGGPFSWRHALAGFLIACLVGGCAGAAAPDASAARATVEAAPVTPPPWIVEPGVAIEAAWELRSGDPRFGGISGILVRPDRMVLVSDRATLWSANRTAGDPRSVPSDWEVRRLERPDGRRVDSESLALRADGTIVIGLEGDTALLELPPRGATKLTTVPKELRAAPRNEGLEALATLADGTLLAIAEGLELEPGRHRAMVLGSGQARALSYAAGPGYAPTAADAIDEWLLVLERRASFPFGLSARLTASRLPGGAIPQAGLPEPVPIAHLLQAGSTDNMEGVAVERGDAPGSYRIWLVADDNFSTIQRTVLLLLSWRPEPPAWPRSGP